MDAYGKIHHVEVLAFIEREITRDDHRSARCCPWRPLIFPYSYVLDGIFAQDVVVFAVGAHDTYEAGPNVNDVSGPISRKHMLINTHTSITGSRGLNIDGSTSTVPWINKSLKGHGQLSMV